jgi:hypothetical protein
MKHKKLFALPLSVLAVLALFAAAYAKDSDKDKLGPYKLLKTIVIPEGLVGFDISWVDSESGRYYFANRGDATAVPPVGPTIDVIDTKHNKFLYAIPLSSAGNGVIAIGKPGDDDEQDAVAGELWVGAADSTVKVIDVAHPFAVPLSIPTGALTDLRADELAYDPMDHVVLIANDRAPKPFVTFISTTTHTVLGKIVYDGTLGNPKTTGGIEQPVWDGLTKKFYISIPSTVAHPDGEVDEINPTTRAITRIFPTSHFTPTCGPAGLALIPGQRLMTSCGDVLDIASGLVVRTVTGAGADEIWYNRGDERVYFGGGTDRISVNVVSGLPLFNLITTLTVGVPAVVSPPAPAHTTHSVAADSEFNRIFVPVSHEGVKVYTDDHDNGEGPDN